MRKYPTNSLLMRDLLVLERLQHELGALISTADFDKRREKVSDLPRRVRTLWERLQRQLTASLAVLQMAGKGFPEYQKTRPQVFASDIERWINEVTGAEVLTFLLRFYVLVACAEVEHFLRSLALAALDPKAVQRIQASRRAPPDLAKKLGKLPTRDAIRYLANWIKPSAASDTPWRQRVELVFGMRVPTPVMRALRSLIRWRHEFSHRGNPPLKVDWATHRADALEATITWYLAGIVLSDHLCLEIFA